MSRYVVTSISGYPITPDMHSLDVEGKRSTEWYVLDRFHCYEIVASFKNTKGSLGGIKARLYALRLNREERRWERQGE